MMDNPSAALEEDSSSAVRKNLIRAVLLDALASDIANVSTALSPASSGYGRYVRSRHEDKNDSNGEDTSNTDSYSCGDTVGCDAMLERCVDPEELRMNLQDITLEPKDQSEMNCAVIEEMDAAIRRLREWQKQRGVIQIVEPPNVFYFEDAATSESKEFCRENGPETDIDEMDLPLSARLADDSKIASLRALLVCHEEEMKCSNEGRRSLLKNLEDQRVSVETASAAIGAEEGSTQHLLQQIEIQREIRVQAMLVQEELLTDGIRLQEQAGDLEDSLRSFNEQLEKYLI